MVAETLPDSPAEKAGIRKGDVILRLGDKEITGLQDLLLALEGISEGKVSLRVLRGNIEEDLHVDFPAERRRFRVRFGSVPNYSFAERGVRFEDIRAGTPAAKAGVKPGDVLVRWGKDEVVDVEQWTQLLRRHQSGDEVTIAVRRGAELVELKVKLEE
jgi:S1-C subfamily serine protease